METSSLKSLEELAGTLKVYAFTFVFLISNTAQTRNAVMDTTYRYG